MAVGTPLRRPEHRQRRHDSDGEEQATELEQHDAAAHRDEPRSGEAAGEAARQAERRLDSGGGDGEEHAADGVSGTKQLPTVTSRGAERRLKTQRNTQSGRSINSGGGDGYEHARLSCTIPPSRVTEWRGN